MNYIKKVKLHSKALKQCFFMIENIEILLQYNNLSIKEIFRVLSNNKTYNLLSFLEKINDYFQNNEFEYFLNDKNISCIKSNMYLNSEDKQILLDFFYSLGKSDLNGQLIYCKTYKDAIKKKQKEYELKEIGECKSTGMLILGIGFLIVILVI